VSSAARLDDPDVEAVAILLMRALTPPYTTWETGDLEAMHSLALVIVSKLDLPQRDRDLRLKIATELRLALIPGRKIPQWAVAGNRPSARGIAEWAARIAEGKVE
jgi:hypothetical protein